MPAHTHTTAHKPIEHARSRTGLSGRNLSNDVTHVLRPVNLQRFEAVTISERVQ